MDVLWGPINVVPHGVSEHSGSRTSVDSNQFTEFPNGRRHDGSARGGRMFIPEYALKEGLLVGSRRVRSSSASPETANGSRVISGKQERPLL